MTDDNRPMDPERLAELRGYLTLDQSAPEPSWDGRDGFECVTAELLRAHDHLASELERLRSDLDLYDRTRLSDLRAQAEATCERRTAERDEALRQLLAPTRPRYSAANLAIGEPAETEPCDCDERQCAGIRKTEGPS